MRKIKFSSRSHYPAVTNKTTFPIIPCSDYPETSGIFSSERTFITIEVVSLQKSVCMWNSANEVRNFCRPSIDVCLNKTKKKYGKNKKRTDRKHLLLQLLNCSERCVGNLLLPVVYLCCSLLLPDVYMLFTCCYL